jgi:amidase
MRRGKNSKPAPENAGRRAFLEAGAKLGAAALAAPALITSALPAPVATAPAALTAAQRAFELEEVTVVDLQKRMQSGELTARSLAEKYLARIEALDKLGPRLRAIIELNPDALAIADALDAERKSKGVRGPLHGIPVLLKDNIGTADRMSTTAGSLALAGFAPAVDSGVARRLRDAGAVILAKNNLSEWANMRSSHSSSGWSGRGGQTRNPYALDRSPCGSSSGSGAAVSANFCAITVGTETDGSIVCPASSNGVVGIKPTVGLASRAGIIPISHSQDTPGPLCRSVADAAALLSVLAGEDAADAATAAARGKIEADYTKFLDRAGLRGARIGVVRKAFEPAENVASVFDEAIAAMKHEGAAIVDPVEIASLGKFEEAELQVLLYEHKTNLDAYLAGAGSKAMVHSMKDVIAFNIANRDKEMPYFGQDLLEKAQAKGPLTDKAYSDALAKNHMLTREQGIDAAIAKYKLDALIAPTAGPTWLIDLIDGDHDTGGSSPIAAVAGYPSIAVPAGYVFGLPVGISIFGAAWSEPTLIRIAYAFEQATKVRKVPRFLPSAPLAR